MFDYDEVSLQGEQNQNRKNVRNLKAPLGQKVWLLVIVFAMFVALSSSLATFFGLPVMIIALVGTGVAFVWLVFALLQVTLKNVMPKLLKVFGFFITIGLIWSLIFGLVNTVTNSTEIMMWIAALAVAPVVIVLFFYFMNGCKLLELVKKINRKVYLELLITLLVGLALTYFPNQIVLRTLLATRLVQFVLLWVINTALIAGIITTCQKRGVI